MSSFRPHRDSPLSCVRSPRVLLLLSVLITSASTCSGRKSPNGVVNGLGEWEFGRAADADSRTNKRVKADMDNRKPTGQSRKVRHDDNDEAPTSLNVASTRPPIRALRQSRRFKLFLPSTADATSSSHGATAADALDRYLGSGENDIFFSHSFSHSYDDSSSDEHDSDGSSGSGDGGGSAEESIVEEEDALATQERTTREIVLGNACTITNIADDLTDDNTTALGFKYEVTGDSDNIELARETIADNLLQALIAAFPNCGSSRRRVLQSVDSSINQVRRATGTEDVKYIEVTSETSTETCTVLNNDGENCSVETGAATALLYDITLVEHVKDIMRDSAIPIFEDAVNGDGIPSGVTVHVIEPTLQTLQNDQIELTGTSDRSSSPEVTQIIVPKEASAGTSSLSPTALTFGCVGALFFGIAVALLQYRRKKSQLGSDDDSASGVSIWSAKPPALAAGESDGESATTALSHSPGEPTNLPIPGAPASSPIVMVKMYGDGKNTVETTAPDYLPPNVPPAICFELMEEKRATPASCAITIDDSEI